MRYRCIDVRIWGDQNFRELTPLLPSGQALFIYLLTTHYTNSIPGLYRAGAAAMAEQLGWTKKDFEKAFQEVLRQGLVKADLDAHVIFIPNAIKYNKPQSANVVISWRLHWDEIPECDLKMHAYQYIKSFLEGLNQAFIKAFDKAIGKPMPIQDQDQDQEQEKTNIHQVASATRPLSPRNEYCGEVTEIFAYWKSVMNHPKAKLDKARKRFITKALKQSYSIEDLKLAIDGCAKSTFHMGENEKKQRYDGINLIFRNAEKIESFIELAKPSSSGTTVFEGAI